MKQSDRKSRNTWRRRFFAGWIIGAVAIACYVALAPVVIAALGVDDRLLAAPLPFMMALLTFLAVIWLVLFLIPRKPDD